MNLSKFLSLLNFLCFLFNRQLLIINTWGDENGSVVKDLSASPGDVSLISASGDLLEKEMATHSSILAWESHGKRSLAESEKSQKSQTCGLSNNNNQYLFNLTLLMFKPSISNPIQVFKINI